MKYTELHHTEECNERTQEELKKFVESLSEEEQSAMRLAVEYFALHQLLVLIHAHGQEKLPQNERFSLKELVKMEEARDHLLERINVLREERELAERP